MTTLSPSPLGARAARPRFLLPLLLSLSLSLAFACRQSTSPDSSLPLPSLGNC